MLDNIFSYIPPVDLFSFVLGVVLGAGLCLALVHYGKKKVQTKIFGKKKSSAKVVRSAEKAFDYFQLETLKRAQSDHLLNSLCPLDDLYVPLPLVYPYPYIDPKSKPADAFEASYLLPFVPELPEFYESVPFRSCTLIAALSSHRHVLIQGNLGTGKTTLCNNTISSILQKKEEATPLHGTTPIYVHYSELDISSIDGEHPELPVYDAPQFRALNLSSQAIRAKFSPLFEAGKIVLFLDGLDETTPTLHKEYIDWLKTLITKFPNIRLAVAANLAFSDSTEPLNFASYYISPLTVGARKGVEAKLRNKLAQMQICVTPSTPAYPFENSPWRRQKNSFANISTVVLSLLADISYSGAAESVASLYEHYVSRFCLHAKQLENLTKCAQLISKSTNHTIHKDKLFALLRNADASATQTDLQLQETSFSNFLIEAGLLVERQQGFYGFAFAPVYAFLLSREESQLETTDWKPFYYAPCENLALALRKDSSYITGWLARRELPLARNIDLLGTHFEKLRNDTALQNQAIPLIVAAMQQNNLCISIKLKYLSLILRLDEETVYKVLEYLYQKLPGERLFAILGFGFIENSKSLAYLKTTLTTGTPLEKAYCALSLSRMAAPEARELLLASLQVNDDLYRRLASEMLATDSSDGYAQIQQLIQDNNIAIRKSGIYGLKLIPEKWVVESLTSLSTDDKEWIVRDTAAAALEEIVGHHIQLDVAAPPTPDKIPWLVSMAEQRNRKLSPAEAPFDLLTELVLKGDSFEKNASLFLLSRYPNKEIKDFLSAQFEGETEVSDQAFFHASEITRHEEPT